MALRVLSSNSLDSFCTLVLFSSTSIFFSESSVIATMALPSKNVRPRKKKTLIPSFMHWSVKQGFACYKSWKCSKSFMHWSQIRLFAKSGDVPERNTHTYWSQYPSHLASEQHLQVSELPWPHFAIDSLVIALCTPESHGAWLLQVCHHPQKHLHNQHCW